MNVKGPWSTSQIEAFLEATRIPVRLACNGAAGHPVLASLWFVPKDGLLWCATQCSASVAALLSRDPACAFEVSVEAPPYRGVRGPAIATLHEDRGEEILRAAIDRYLGDDSSKLAKSLLARASKETAIAIAPREIVSWDFSERMGDAGRAVAERTMR